MTRSLRWIVGWLGALAHAAGLAVVAIALVDGGALDGKAAGVALCWCISAGARMVDARRVPGSLSTWVGAAWTGVLEELARTGVALSVFAAAVDVLVHDGKRAGPMVLLAVSAHCCANGMRLCRRALCEVDAPWEALAFALAGLLVPSSLLRGAGRMLLGLVATLAAWGTGILLVTGEWRSALFVALAWLGFSWVLRAAHDGELTRLTRGIQGQHVFR